MIPRIRVPSPGRYSAKQRERVLGYIQKGVDEGARLVAGGVETPEGFERGFFVQPTLFVDVDNSMTIAQEEIFGPVLSVIPYEDDDDAVRIANDSVYGFAGYVMSGSMDRSMAVTRRLRAGSVGLNGAQPTALTSPSGDTRRAASGVRTATPASSSTSRSSRSPTQRAEHSGS